MRALHIAALVTMAVAGDAGDGSWRLEYPPWDDPASPMMGSPELFIPIMGPLTKHPCMPSRAIAMRVAVSHLNRRDSTFCPAIATLRKDFEVKYALQDTHASASGAILAAMKLMEADTSAGRVVGTAEAKLKVVLGPNSSPEAAGVHPFLGGAFSISYISWAATMGALSNKDVYRYFFRVVAPDQVTMSIQAGFVKWLGYRSVNVLFVDDNALTTGQAEDFIAAAANTHGMQVTKYPIPSSGEAGFSSTALSQTRASLVRIEATKVRVIGCYAVGQAVREILAAAEEMHMAQGPGWFWFGGDGLEIAITGDPEVDAKTWGLIAGQTYAKSVTQSSLWDAFADKWRQDMGNLSAPEFREPICHSGTVCEGRSDFFGVDREGARCLNSWLREAYVSMVTMAVAADRRMSSTGKLPSAFTRKDWFEALQTFIEEPFDCLSGKMQLSAKQERASDVYFFQFQAHVGKPVKVATWDATRGYGWLPGATLTWADGSHIVVMERDSSVEVPSGKPPVCPSGEAYSLAAQRCEPCPEGKSAILFQGVAVCMCAAGYGIDDEGIEDNCHPCASGTFKGSTGGQPCSPCPVGAVSPAPGATACEPCALGTYAEVMGLSSCSTCGNGATTAVLGASNKSQCTCDVDYYATSEGLCAGCPAGAMTSGIGKPSMDHCLCPSGSYKPMDRPEECLPCLDGMVCVSNVDRRLFGSVQRGGPAPPGLDLQPVLEQFYWSSADQPLLVFRCSSGEKCPGGLPGTACGPNLHGRACERCGDGQRWDGLQCSECPWWARSILLFPVVPTFFLPLLVVILYRMFGDPYEKWNSLQNGCAAVLFIVINHYQIISILAGADVPYTKGAGTFMSSFRFAGDVTNLFNRECRGMGSITTQLGMKAVGPMVVAMIWAATYFGSQGLAVFLKRPAMALELNRTLNGFLSLMLTFFAGIAEMALVLFKCVSNTRQNPLTSLATDRSIICFDEEWMGLLGIGIAAVLLWVCGFGGYFVRTVILAPQWFHDRGAQMRYKFLFIKYRSDVHWWALTFVCKGLLLNLVFVLFHGGVAQVYCVVLIALLYIMGVIGFMPWRHMVVNYIDIWLHVCVILVCSVLMWFIRGRVEQHDAAASDRYMTKLLIGFGCMGSPASLTILSNMVWHKLSRQAKRTVEEEKEMVLATMLEVAQAAEKDRGSFMTFLASLSEWDYYYLNAAMKVWVTEFFGFRVRAGVTAARPSEEAVDRLLLTGAFNHAASHYSTPRSTQGGTGSSSVTSLPRPIGRTLCLSHHSSGPLDCLRELPLDIGGDPKNYCSEEL